MSIIILSMRKINQIIIDNGTTTMIKDCPITPIIPNFTFFSEEPPDDIF